MSLKSKRLEKGYTLQALAEKSGVHFMKIHQIENGKINVENITLKNGLRLAEALDCHPRELLDDDSGESA